MEPSTIVVGTDYSLGARAAYLAAQSFARRLGGHLTVVHVTAPAGREPESARVDAARWSAECGVDLASIVVRRGTAWLELIRVAREEDAAILVMGRHGQSGFQPIELGSTAARVGLAAPCPVMLIGEGAVGSVLLSVCKEPDVLPLETS